MVEFIKYDGKWPCLCFGTLIIKVDGKTYHLENAMISGGGVWHDSGWDSVDVTQGPWKIDLYKFPELKPYEEEITQVVNENVEWGCCGGCV